MLQSVALIAFLSVCHALKPGTGLPLLSAFFEVYAECIAFLCQFLHDWKYLGKVHWSLSEGRVLFTSKLENNSPAYVALFHSSRFLSDGVLSPTATLHWILVFDQIWCNIVFAAKEWSSPAVLQEHHSRSMTPRFDKMFWYSPLLGLSANWSLAFIFMFEISA